MLGGPQGVGPETKSMRPGRERPVNWPPESLRPAVAFTDSGEFTYLKPGPIRGNPNYGRTPVRLRAFSGLRSATIQIELPYEAEWTGDVPSCT